MPGARSANFSTKGNLCDLVTLAVTWTLADLVGRTCPAKRRERPHAVAATGGPPIFIKGTGHLSDPHTVNLFYVQPQKFGDAAHAM